MTSENERGRAHSSQAQVIEHLAAALPRISIAVLLHALVCKKEQEEEKEEKRRKKKELKLKLKLKLKFKFEFKNSKNSKYCQKVKHYHRIHRPV